MTIPPHTLTLTLTEELGLIETLARERGIDEPADVLRALLHDAVEIYDAVWDRTFAKTQDVLDMLADEAHTEYAAGLKILTWTLTPMFYEVQDNRTLS